MKTTSNHLSLPRSKEEIKKILYPKVEDVINKTVKDLYNNIAAKNIENFEKKQTDNNGKILKELDKDLWLAKKREELYYDVVISGNKISVANKKTDIIIKKKLDGFDKITKQKKDK